MQYNRPQICNRDVSSDSASVPTTRVLTEILECENREEQDECVQVFTSQPLSAVSSSYVSDRYGYSYDGSTPADYYGHKSQTQSDQDLNAEFIDKLETYQNTYW